MMNKSIITLDLPQTPEGYVNQTQISFSFIWKLLVSKLRASYINFIYGRNITMVIWAIKGENNNYDIHIDYNEQ